MDFSGLQAYQQGLIRKGVPGCEIIVCKDHKVLYHDCLGIAQPSNRYYLYSCTKPITAVAAAICLEKNLFRLDDEVARYLPAFADVKVAEGVELIPPKQPITIHHLMTMSAGLDYDFDTDPLKHLPQDATTIQFANALAKHPLSFHPGAKYQYSFCLDVLGAVIETATNQTLGQWCTANIFHPLAMSDTSFFLAGVKEPRIAKQFRYVSAERRVQRVHDENALVPYSRFFSGGAGVVSTATDYAKFADTLACGTTADGYQPISKAMVDLIRTSQHAMEELKSSFTCTCGSDYAYGLGVRTRIHKAEDAPGSLGEFGWDGAAGADVLIDPDRHLSAVLLQHVLGWPGLLGSFHLEFRDAIYRSIDTPLS